jgi:hypothetical protein
MPRLRVFLRSAARHLRQPLDGLTIIKVLRAHWGLILKPAAKEGTCTCLNEGRNQKAQAAAIEHQLCTILQ